MTYDFSRFSTQSFERLTQALSVAQLGSGTQVFGAGPDGAREACFEGGCSPAPNASAWNGYVVVQAKYLSEPKDTKTDFAWLKAQIDKDLKKFQNPKKNLRVPEFYIVSSNVKLTPGAANSVGKGGGTQDQFLRHMDHWKKTLGIKDIYVWHKDVLCSLLDVHSGVRALFSAWTTAGDALAAVLAAFEQPEFADVALRAMREEIKDQRGIKTRDSGQSHGRQVYIDEVFVDLPVTPISLFDISDLSPSDIDEDEDEEDRDEQNDDLSDDGEDDGSWAVESGQWNVLRLLFNRLSDKLDSSGDTQRRSHGNRLVIMGGPGQGKSTLGQFMSQVLRAKLLAGRKNVPPEILEAANATLKRAREEGIDLSGPSRYPFHIALPKYADVISKQSECPPSLLKFLSDQLSRYSDEKIAPKIVRRWLGQYPSVVVLDGLDEVPRTGNRAAVIEEIGRFIGEIHEVQADTLIAVTSRPQGYLDDLDSKHWAHWHLADLDPTNAVRFGSRLSDVLITERSRRHEIVSTLRDAASEPAIAALMISPLQVSLMFSLVVTKSDIPKDRWTLFERHYEILRDREIAKGGASGELIRDFRNEIDRIHYDAGFLLQVRAEMQGNASAHFTLPEFKELILENLRQSMVDHERVSDIARRLMDVAIERLVFLGDRNDDRIAFDVRSLQEFMAAARIMMSPERQIRARLVEIAHKSHWAHVFRIACSKVYAQPSLVEFRKDILAILDGMDRGDSGPEYREARAGARLAVALLADASAGAREVDRSQLMSRAVELLEVADVEAARTLVPVCDPATRASIERGLDEALETPGTVAHEAALLLLAMIVRHDGHSLSQWALSKLANRTLSAEQCAKLLEAHLGPGGNQEARGHHQELMWRAGPGAIRSWPRSEHSSGLFPSERVVFKSGEADVILDGDEIAGLSIAYQAVRAFEDLEFPILPEYAHPGWNLYERAFLFSRKPSIAALVAALEVAPEPGEVTWGAFDLPWPISYLADHIRRGRDRDELLDEVRSGKHGDEIAWDEAERRWGDQGVLFSALPLSEDFESLLAQAGRCPPFRIFRRSSGRKIAVLSVAREFNAWSSPQREEMLPIVIFMMETSAEAVDLLFHIGSILLTMKLSLAARRRLLSVLSEAVAKGSPTNEIRMLARKVTADLFDGRGARVSPGMRELLNDEAEAGWVSKLLVCGLPSFRDGNLHSRRLSGVSINLNVNEDESTLAALAAIKVMARDVTVTGVKEVTNLLTGDPSKVHWIIRKIHDGQRTMPTIEQIIASAATNSIESPEADRAKLAGILMEVLATRTSRFIDAGALEELGLPEDVRVG